MTIVIKKISIITTLLLLVIAPLSFTRLTFKSLQQNPTLSTGCKMNVSLVLDASGSVALANALGEVKEASQSFLNGLKDTSSKANMWWFGGKASALVPSLTSVTDQTLSDDGWFGAGLNRYIAEKPPEASSVIEHKFDEVGDLNNESSYVSLSDNARELTWTNWDDALGQVNSVVEDPNKKPDLVVLFTDGTPSAYNLDTSGDLFYDTNNTDDIAVNLQSQNQLALSRAEEQADLLKQQGIKVFTVGVGNVVSNNGIEGLKRISGPNVVNLDEGDQLDITTDDVLLTSDFANLTEAMKTLVNEMCKGSLTINKKLQYNDGIQTSAQTGWHFNVDSNEVELSGNGDTNVEGQANFSWDSSAVTDNFLIHIDEDANSKWSFDSLVCRDQSAGENVDTELPVFENQSGGYDIEVKPNSNIVCDATNKYIASNGLEVVKTASKSIVNGLDGGEEVVYTYEVTNVGEETLFNLRLVDNKCSPIVIENYDNDADISIAPGEKIIATCVKVLQHELTSEDVLEVNIVKAEANTQNGEIISGEAQAEVKIITPSIKVVKSADKTSITPGETVTKVHIFLSQTAI